MFNKHKVTQQFVDGEVTGITIEAIPVESRGPDITEIPFLLAVESKRGGEGRMVLSFEFSRPESDGWSEFYLFIGGPQASQYKDDTKPEEYEREGPVINKNPANADLNAGPGEGDRRVLFYTFEPEDIRMMLNRDMGFSLMARHLKSGEKRAIANGMLTIENDSVTVVGSFAAGGKEDENKNNSNRE